MNLSKILQTNGSLEKYSFFYYNIEISEERSIKVFTMDLRITQQSELVGTLKDKTEFEAFMPTLINSL